MEGCGFDLAKDLGHLCVADLDLAEIGVRFRFGVQGQPGASPGRAYQFGDHLMAGQGLAPTVHGDVSEGAVLDLVPLASPG